MSRSIVQQLPLNILKIFLKKYITWWFYKRDWESKILIHCQSVKEYHWQILHILCPRKYNCCYCYCIVYTVNNGARIVQSFQNIRSNKAWILQEISFQGTEKSRASTFYCKVSHSSWWLVECLYNVPICTLVYCTVQCIHWPKHNPNLRKNAERVKFGDYMYIL